LLRLRLLPLDSPPRLDEPSELEIAAARDLLMPFLRRPSYCLSFFTLEPWSLAIVPPLWSLRALFTRRGARLPSPKMWTVSVRAQRARLLAAAALGGALLAGPSSTTAGAAPPRAPHEALHPRSPCLRPHLNLRCPELVMSAPAELHLD